MKKTLLFVWLIALLAGFFFFYPQDLNKQLEKKEKEMTAEINILEKEIEIKLQEIKEKEKQLSPIRELLDVSDDKEPKIKEDELPISNYQDEEKLVEVDNHYEDCLAKDWYIYDDDCLSRDKYIDRFMKEFGENPF